MPSQVLGSGLDFEQNVNFVGMMDADEYNKLTVIVIKSIREYLGHSTEQLARALNIKENEYKRLESMEVEMTVGQCHAITAIMGFSILYMFSISEAYDKFNVKSMSESEIQERIQEIWFNVHERIGIDKEGYDFFKTNLAPILLQIKETQVNFDVSRS